LTSDFRFTHPGQGERRCLRSLLTSSQNHPAQRLASLTVMAMVLSSRDRIRQRRLTTMVNGHRQDAAACVSLSKSTMSKTVWPENQTRRNARRRREAGLYPPPVAVSIDLNPRWFNPKQRCKNHLGAAGECPVVRQ
jgi:hypothetical protein